MRATLACLLTCVWIVHVLQISLNNEKRSPKKLNVAYNKVKISKM